MDDLRPATRHRGFAVAAVRALGARADGVCAARAPSLRRWAVELAQAPARLSAEAARLGRDLPDGLGDVHASWFSAPAPSASPAAAHHLARRAYGHLVEMNAEHALERHGSAALASLLLALGRRRAATAFSGAPRGPLARLCARLGEPAGSQLAAEVRQIAALARPIDVLAAQRALSRGGELVDEDATQFLTRLGAAWLGPALAGLGGDLARRIAQRLPRAAGRALLAAADEDQDDDPDDAEAALTAAAALLALTHPRAV